MATCGVLRFCWGSFDDLDAWVRIGLIWTVPMFLMRLCFEAWADCTTASAPLDLSAATLTGCMCIPNSVPREWRVASASSSSSAKPARRPSSGRSVLILASWWANFLVVLLLVLAYFFASLSPLSQICPALANLRPAAADQLFAIGRTWYLVSGYGLFRRMTGVGQASAVLANSGGVAIPTVARPELELQGSDDGKQWTALEFRFKPGNVTDAPVWTGFPGFPGSFSGMHQPRLDWQMWFAALGSYQHNPWLVSLVIKLLGSSQDAKNLMAPERWPPEWRGEGKAPKQIRIIAFEYDFSRLNSTDAASGKWWSRKRVGEYLPPLYKDHPAIVEFQRSVGQDKPLDSKEKGEAHGVGALLKAIAVAVRAHTTLLVRCAMGLGLAVTTLNIALAVLPASWTARRTAATAPKKTAAHLKSE